MKKLQSIIRRYDVLLIIIGLLLLWEFLCYRQIIPSYLLPAPSQIITVLFGDRRLLLYHSSYTLLEALIGLSLGVLGGSLVATCMYYSAFLNRLFSPLMMLTQTIPSVAIAPLLILWLGYGMKPKILLIFLTCFFPITNSLLTGFQTADPDCLALLQSMNATRKQTFFSFLLPNAFPDFFSGLRVASTYAIVGAVVAEWLGGERGLGVYMTRARKSFSFDRMFAVILVIVLLSQLLLLCIRLLQKRMMPWQSSTTKTERSI